MPREAPRVEQRRRSAAMAELVSEGSKTPGVARQGKRQSFVLQRQVWPTRADRWPAGGLPYAARKLTEAAYDRQPGPERITGGGMRVLRKSVEKQIGQPQSREVVGGAWHVSREQQSLRSDAEYSRFTPQINHRRRIQRFEPQHATLDRAQQSHPDIEYLGAELVLVIVASKNETHFR